MKDVITMMVDKVTVRAILALGLLATIIYLVVTGQEVNEIISNAFMVVLGFYFAVELNNRLNARARLMSKKGE